MKHDCMNILDDNGIELLVGFDYEKSSIEDPEGENDYYYIELTSVEVVIKGKGIDILPQLNDKQGTHISGLIGEYLAKEEAYRVKYPLNHY